MKRAVVTCSIGSVEGVNYHEVAKNAAVSRMIADLKGWDFVGEYRETTNYTSRLYFVPHRTIVGIDVAARIGIHTADDLYGGVVPYGYLATKAITHGLVAHRAKCPPNWSNAFSDTIHDAVLPGYTAFSVDDAQLAGKILLKDGPVRIKKVLAAGGEGQSVARIPEELASMVATINSDELTCFGLVLERNLENAMTYSVGQVQIDDLTASYYGTQYMTDDKRGNPCYGGSDLVIVRGGWDQLLSRDLPNNFRLAVCQTVTYDRALKFYPDVIVSRRNYDVGQGTDSNGNFLSGVLEQGWRIGGASGREVAALLAFRDDPGLQVVEASSYERYGENIETPEECLIQFDGIDPKFGPMKVFTVVKR